MLLAGLSACGPPESSPPIEDAAGPVLPTETGPAPAEPAPRTESGSTSAPETPTPSRSAQGQAKDVPRSPSKAPESHADLSDLLRLPDSGPPPRRTAPVEWPPSMPAASQPEARDAEKPGRFGVEYRARTDGSAVQPERSRTQTDAGVSVDVSDGARLKGGVRIEQENGKERERPTPTVGLEKRF